MVAQIVQIPRRGIVAPTFLQEIPGWLVWKYEQVTGEAKPRKVPYYVGGGRRHGVQGSPDDRAKLVAFDQAAVALQSGKWAGVGLAMLPEWGLVGLDFDHCVADDKVLPDVQRLVAGTYAEMSPSGNGVRAFMRGALADRKSRADAAQFGFEVFHAKGFLTFTGHVLDACALMGDEDTVAPVTSDVLRLCAERFGAAVGGVAPTVGAGGEWEADDPLMVTPPLGLRVAELIEMVGVLDPDCDYRTWCQVGMACHHERDGGEDGFLVWDDWSARSGKYPGREILRAKWASFGRNAGFSVTARWLVKAFNDKTRTEKLLLAPNDVLNTARMFVETACRSGEGVTLLRNAGQWFEHGGACYVEKPEESLRARMWDFLDGALKNVKQKKEDGTVEAVTVPFHPNVSQVSAAMDALKAVTLVEGAAPPCWLGGCTGPEPREIVSLTNGLLHVPTRRLLPHTVGLFNLNTLPYAWQAGGKQPREWIRFLNTVWPDDFESIDTLQEVFGYLLTPDTSQQKMFLIVGPRRSGKGTIGRVLRALVGPDNTASPTLNDLTTSFGLAPLINKLVAIIPDARVGGQTNKQAAVERLLMVSGEDSIAVDRKFLSAWTGPLSARFVFLTNETPQLGDASGALSGRFITLEMRESFYGREDRGLTARLLEELPEIFKWALEGRDRLQQRGHFIQPVSAADAVTELEESNSPIGAFVDECCELGAGYQVKVTDIFGAWHAWCTENGREHCGTVQSFARLIRAASAGLRVSKPRVGGAQQRCYDGIRVKESFLTRISEI